MVFNSYLFIIIFLPFFLLAFYTAGIIRDDKLIPFIVIIVSSLIFCARSGYFNCLFVVFDIVVNYIFYLVLCKKRTKAFLGLFISLNVLFLGVFKYLDMTISLMNVVFGTDIGITNIEAPLGISFFTFQQIAFLVYVYKNPDFKAGLISYSVFVSFFPHVLSGPILFTEPFFENLKKKLWKVDWHNMATGFLFSIGLAKKTLLADVYGQMVDAGYASIESLNMGSALFVSLAYTLQIYFDFSGYCDMAIGVGRMVNVDLPMNFNSPYKAKTVDEFWDRWHMTLTRFLTQYVYIPLGGNRNGDVRTYVNIMIVFLISGLWHGASLTFVLWGTVHGMAMIVSRLLRNTIKKISGVFTQVLTFLFVNFAWIIFRAGTFTKLKEMARAFTKVDFALSKELQDSFSKVGWLDLTLGSKQALMLSFIALGLVLSFIPRNSLEIAENFKWKWYSAVFFACLVLFCIFSFTGTSTYIYLRF